MRNLIEKPAGLYLKDRNKVGRINQCFIFGPFGGIKITLVGAFTEHYDPCLHWLVYTEGNETPSRLLVEA